MFSRLFCVVRRLEALRSYHSIAFDDKPLNFLYFFGFAFGIRRG